MEFKCEICEKVLKTASGLKRHLKSQHEGNKSLTCEVCDREFSSMSGKARSNVLNKKINN